jgi:hypothetical protein
MLGCWKVDVKINIDNYNTGANISCNTSIEKCVLTIKDKHLNLTYTNNLVHVILFKSNLFPEDDHLWSKHFALLHNRNTNK